MNHPMMPPTIAEVLSRLSDEYAPFVPVEELGLDETFLGDVYVNEYAFTEPADGSFRTSISLSVYVAEGGRLEISAADFLGIEIVDHDEPEFVSFTIELVTQLDPFAATMTVADVPVAFWLANDTLRRVEEIDGTYQPIDEPFRIETSLTLALTTDFQAAVTFPDGFDVPAFAIGDTGLICEVDSFNFTISADDPTLSVQRVRLVLPEDIRPFGIPLPQLVFDDVTVGRSGFSGVVSAIWPLAHDAEDPDRPYFYDIEGEPDARLFGLWGGVESIQVTVVDNLLTGSELKGRMVLPWFDEPVAVTIRLETAAVFEAGLPGLDFRIEVRGEDGAEIELRKEELLALYAQHIAVQKAGSTGIIEVTGGLEPLLWASDGLEWPRLDVKELVLEQNLADLRDPPRVRFREAWLDLKDLATLDLFGFHFELERIGVGYVDETDKLWLDLTGSLRLIDQIPIGLGVEGFRITWPRTLHEDLLARFGAGDIETVLADPEGLLALGAQIEVRFAGIYVFFGVPQAVEFEGLIRFIKEAQVVGFAGDMALRLPATGLALEAGLMAGINFEDPPYPFLYLYFGILLPSGIPLGQSGLAFKGAKGLFGLNVVPDRTPEQNPYYDWYKRGPIEGAHPTNKWRHHRWSVALGAGVTITTTDGKILGLQGLLVLVVPGPIVMIEGKTLIFDGIFPIDGPLKGLGYFDGGTRTVQLNIEAGAEVVEDVVDVNANLEAFFDFTDPTNWHLYLGKDTPADRRVRAEFLKLPAIGWLFSGSSYLMLDMTPELTVRARLGVAIGFEPPSFDVVVASVSLAARIDGEGLLTLNPFAFTGSLTLDADLDISAFGFVGIGATADAEVRTAGPRPLVVSAELAVSVELPVPDVEQIPVAGEWIDDAIAWFEEEIADLPDIPDRLSFSVPFSWRYDGPPRVDPVVTGVSADRAVSLADRSVAAVALAVGADERTAAEAAPVIALDAKPVVAFDQHMHTTADVRAAGFPTTPVIRPFAAGDFLLLPTLHEVVVSRAPKAGSGPLAWEPIARATAPVDGPEGLWAFWRADADPTGGQNRVLRCWTTNPFEWLVDQPAVALPVASTGDDGRVEAGAAAVVARGLHLAPPPAPVTAVCVGSDELKTADPSAIHRVPVGTTWWEQLELEGVALRSLSLELRPPGRQAAAIIGTGPDRSTAALHLHFPEPVVEVRLRVRDRGAILHVEARTAPPLRIERGREGFVARVGDDCALVAGASIAVEDDVIVVRRDGGLRCLDVMGKGPVELLEVCWITRAAVQEAARLAHVGAVNAEVVGAAPAVALLPADHYYRVDVTTTVELIGEEHGPLLELLEAFDADMADFLELHTAPVTPVTRSWVFQTDGPPRDLDRYVKWSSVDDVPRVFAADDQRIRFRRSYVHAMYGGGTGDGAPYRIAAHLVDAEGRVSAELEHRWSTAGSATELPVERDWRDLVESQLDVVRPLPPDDVLVVATAHTVRIDDTGWETLDPRANEVVQFTPVAADGDLRTAATVTAKDPGLVSGRGRAAAGPVVGHPRGDVVGAQVVVAGEDATLVILRRLRGASTMLAARPLAPAERARLPFGVRLDVAIRHTGAGLELRAAIDGGAELVAVDEVVRDAGRVGFLVGGTGLAVTEGTWEALDSALRPAARYRLVVTGGEGGRPIVDDRFDGPGFDDRWHDEQAGWTLDLAGAVGTPGAPLWWHEPFEDVELVAHLSLDAGDEVAAVVRHPRGRPEGGPGTFYELGVRAAAGEATVRLVAASVDHTDRVVVTAASLPLLGSLSKLRVRVVGDRVLGWLDERPAVDVRLAPLPITPGTVGRPGLPGIVVRPRRGAELPVARSGGLGLRVVSGDVQVRRVRLAAPALVEIPFATSAFRSFHDLIRSADGAARRRAIDGFAAGLGGRLATARQALTDLATTRARHAAVVVDHRDMIADRESLEASAVALRATERAADEAFDACVGQEPARDPLPERLEVTALTVDRETVGLLLASPEPLDVAAPLQAEEPTVPPIWGRTSVALVPSEPGAAPTPGPDPTPGSTLDLAAVARADGTRVLCYLPGSDGPISIPAGGYVLRFSHVRDPGDDALAALDHRYDRPVHSSAGRTEPVVAVLPVVL